MSDPNLTGTVQVTATTASSLGNDPSLLFMQLYHGPMQSIWLKGKSPLLLPRSDAVDRAIKNIDRITACETRKLGVLYLGPEQKSAAEMFSNQFGSVRYEQFLDGLGTAIRLEDVDPNLVYIGGLETGGKDGKFAYHWSDPVTQVVFHVATLMPTKDSDPECRQKKLHIGNDYVTIVYNDSGEEYHLGMISGQFAQVAVVVEPVDDYSVSIKVKAKDEVSRWLALKQAVVNDASAPAVCRLIACQADLSMKVWQAQEQHEDPYISLAVERLRQIRKLYEKVGASPRDGSFLAFT